MALAFRLHQQWWYDKFWRQVLLPAMMQMANQLTSVGIYQMMGIGMQFDAKEQLEAQLLLQKMNVQAQKDYTPSSDFCAVGTNTRSLAASMEKSRHNTMALNAMALERHLGTRGSISAEQDNDKRARWQQFAEKYCNEKDNAYQTPQKSDPQPSGLQGVCGQIEDKNRTNLDVDYRRQIEEPLTIMADFTDAAVDAPEEDLVALARNLYGHNTLLRNTPNLNKISGARKYLTLRSVAAKRAVAENSFYNIAGLKMAGSDPANPENRKKTKETMAAVLKQLGMPEDEIEPFIGKNPSVYAQLEILAKKIFQSTGFFASLYDKPANVERRKVAMAAIGLMVDRAIYESRLRQEMLASVLISARLQPEFDRIQENMVATRSQE
ncbi:MAG: hypothetical protein LRZ85_03915 [Alphaproteobacteria bacterium]|nr:hypothetical protein [Alphaproteobacteria bacterium]MCD8571654.1 hypothetical protein [Alphaproteobacteria bacterium]